jgi:hypothetical protein
MRVRVDTAVVLTADDDPAVAGLPAGMTAHPITIRGNVTDWDFATKGFAVMGPSSLGARIYGPSVRSYVLPRMARLLGELYGV